MSNSNQLEMMERIALDLEGVERALASSFNTGSEDFNTLIRPLSEAGGKRLRAQLCLLIANAGTSVEAERIKIAEAVERSFLISSPVLWKVNLCKWKMCIALTKA